MNLEPKTQMSLMFGTNKLMSVWKWWLQLNQIQE